MKIEKTIFWVIIIFQEVYTRGEARERKKGENNEKLIWGSKKFNLHSSSWLFCLRVSVTIYIEKVEKKRRIRESWWGKFWSREYLIKFLVWSISIFISYIMSYQYFRKKRIIWDWWWVKVFIQRIFSRLV